VRILFIAPYPPSRVRPRPLAFIQALAGLGHRVRLVCMCTPEENGIAPVPLGEVCDSVEVVPVSATRTIGNAARAAVTGVPLQALYAFSARAAARVRELADPRVVDVLHVEHLRAAPLVEGVAGVPRVFDAVDSITTLCEQAIRYAPDWPTRCVARFELDRTRRYERRLPPLFDRVLVTSSHEAAAYATATGLPVHLFVPISNALDLEYFRPADTPRDADIIVFTGKMSYHANVAAVGHLVTDILPRVWRTRPSTRLVIAGRRPPASVRALAREPRIHVTGDVADLRRYLRSAAVAAVPLVYGVGVQNKVLEAMACATPVVASPAACRSLGAEPGRDIECAGSPDDFAAAIVRVLDDPGGAARLGEAGRRYVETNHAPAVIGRHLVAIYGQACGGSAAANGGGGSTT
jgi:glycosyltransferase involved in cell wall biosynthesis